MNHPPRCPYCGSIENHGNICDWCHNPISDSYINESEDKKMKVKIEFTDLDPVQALELIKCAAAHSTEDAAGAVPAMTPPAPVQTAAVPVASAVPAQPVAVPAAAAPVPPVVASAVPTAPVTPPTAVKQYTADELALAARPVCEIPGGREKLLDLLHSFTCTDRTGVQRAAQSIMEVPPEQYPALANGIRQLGGRI